MDFNLPPDPTEMGGGDEGASKPNKTPEPPKGKEETVQEGLLEFEGPTETELKNPNLTPRSIWTRKFNQGTVKGVAGE